MDAVITLLLCVLATARLTQLAQFDRITLWFRAAITKRVAARHGVTGNFSERPEVLAQILTRRNEQAPLPLYWLICTWCVSIAAAVLPAVIWVWWAHHPAARFLVSVLAFSLLSVYLREGWLLLAAKRAMYTSVPQAEPGREEAHS